MPWSKEEKKEIKRQKIAAGHCGTCNRPRGADGTVTKCRRCANKSNEMIKRMKAKKKKLEAPKVLSKTICETCRKNESINIELCPLCYRCYFSGESYRLLGAPSRWKELQKLWQDQGGVCCYTGRPIRIGVNARVIHKNPQCLTNEEQHSIQNAEWVDSEVISLKRHLCREEFAELINLIASHMVDNKETGTQNDGPTDV